jgi:hypothetical protein
MNLLSQLNLLPEESDDSSYDPLHDDLFHSRQEQAERSLPVMALSVVSLPVIVQPVMV